MSAATPIKMYPIINDNQKSDIQENAQTGHVKIYRSLKKHWLWKASRKKSKLEAWLDLLMLAAYEDTKEPFGYDLIMLKRGQLLTSQDKLSKEWLWDRSAVRLFLNQLEDDGMIQVNTTAKYTMITICKYVSYHSLQPSKQQVDNNKPTSKQHIQESKELKEAYSKVEKTKKGIHEFLKSKPLISEPYKDFWNLFAVERNLSKVDSITSKRKSHLFARLSEPDFDFSAILKKAATSDFLTTGGKTKFFSFDWIIKNEDNYHKILEGQYDNAEPSKTDTAKETEQQSHIAILKKL